MNKMALLGFSGYLVCALLGCATNSGIVMQNDDGIFETTYDEVQDKTIITHKDMKNNAANLKYNVSGEQAGIRLFIVDNVLILSGDYTYEQWPLLNSLVFLDGAGDRLEISEGERIQTDVGENIWLGNIIVKERYIAALTIEQARALQEILQTEKPTVSFVGAKYRSAKLLIKPNVKSAMLETIKKWQTLNINSQNNNNIEDEFHIVAFRTKCSGSEPGFRPL